MKRVNAFYLIIFLTTFGINLSQPVFAEICNRIVAVVNDEVITLHELNEKIKELTGIESSDLKNQDKEGFIEARRKVLDLLIDEKIALDKSKELGIEVTSKEVDSAIENIKKRNRWTQADLEAGLNQQGISFEQYREKVRKELEQMRLIDFEVKSKIIVRDETVKEYYEAHADEFKSEEKVRLAIIFLANKSSTGQHDASSPVQKTEKILAMLKEGQDFGELAKKFSQGPGAESGGDIGFIKTSQLEPTLKKVIDDLEIGEVSKPIASPSGIQIMKLIERQAKGVKGIEEVKDAIYDVLYSEEIKNRYSLWIKELRDKAYIRIIF